MEGTLLAWHFLRDDRRLGYNDNREARVGETLTIDCAPVICNAGLHACEKPLDALKYAPGPTACRVRLSGTIVTGTGDDGTPKAAATERTVLAMADATSTLHEFACVCAERALQHERAADREPDPRSWAAIETKRRWLLGDASDSELAAARDAAWAAARDAARDAARAAARDAAWDAARAAARDAAWDAAWDEQNKMLTSMLLELLGLTNGEPIATL